MPPRMVLEGAEESLSGPPVNRIQRASFLRALARNLRQESPLALAREAIWRVRRKWERSSRLARSFETSCPVTFRDIPYYAPNLSAFSKVTVDTTTGIADDICRGRFHFLGYGAVDLGPTPKWNADFVSGSEWPEIPLKNGQCVRFDGSDVKVPYELSRLQFLPVLGKAYLLTGNSRYRETAKYLLSCWIGANPVGIGINWSLAMEVALRAMSICFLLNLLSPLQPQEKKWMTCVTRSLWQHFLYIEANLEFSHLVRSNHYLSNLLGLYCLSMFLEGERLFQKRRRYRALLENEIFKQVYEDGGDYEASTGYHVLVTQMFTSALLLMRADSGEIDSRFADVLRKMYRFMSALASPSGQLPHFGDCDDGRVELLLDDLKQMLFLPITERNSLRVSSLLGLGACLFGEGRDTGEDTAWYGLTRSNQSAHVRGLRADHPSLSQPEIVLFPDSGIATAKTQGAEVLFFAAGNGIDGKGSHTHNDKLSLVLRLNGQEVLCDPGTACYTRDVVTRNRFRTTRAHNTVVIGDREQNEIEPTPTGVFCLGKEAKVSRIEHGEEHGHFFLRASHYGYRSLGVTHTRTIWLPLGESCLIAEDILDGSGAHRFEVNFQLASGWTLLSILEQGRQFTCRLKGAQDLKIVFTGSVQGFAGCRSSLISTTYGSTKPAVSLRFWGKAQLPASLTTQICWADIDKQSHENLR